MSQESKDKQPISLVEAQTLANAMDKKYTIYLDDRFFKIEVSVKEGGVFVTTTLQKPDKSYVYPVETRILHNEESLSTRKAATFLIDYIDGYFEEFLTTVESTYLPIDWADMEYEGVSFQMKGQILNLKVEQMADELLASGKAYDGPNTIY